VIWDLAQGIDIEPLRPRPWETPITEGLSYEDPTTSLQSVITAVELLLKRALSRPEIYGRMARTITLIGHGYSGASWEKHYSFKSPTRDERRILSRVWMSLEDTTLPEPLEALSLTLKHITGEGGVQKSLFPEVRRREELNKTIRQLNANLGKAAPLFNLKELEPWSRIPEERHALVQYVP
jgi:DNA polymerase-4/protein ImuB